MAEEIYVAKVSKHARLKGMELLDFGRCIGMVFDVEGKRLTLYLPLCDAQDMARFTAKLIQNEKSDGK